MHSRLFVIVLTALSLLTAPVCAEPAVPGLTLQQRVGHVVVGVTPEGRVAAWDVRNPDAPRKVAERDPGGPVVDLRVAEGTIFVVVVHQEIRAYTLTDGGALDLYRAPTTATAPAPQVAGQPHGPLGRVETVSRGHVLIVLDAGVLVRPGDAVLVRSQVRETQMNLFTGREEDVVSNAPTAVLEVRQVQGGRALAELARGDAAMPGDTVEATEREVKSSHAHAGRTGYDRWLRATLRPMFNLGDVNIASVTDISAGLYWRSLHVQARVAPIGLSVPNRTDVVNVHAIVSYQNDYAEFGVGGGYFRHAFEAENSGECDNSGYLAGAKSGDGTAGQPTTYQCRQQGPTVVQHLRLGTVDGLHVRLTNTLAISDGKFRFGYFEASGDVPISREINLYGAGGGSTGVQWGELGMRTYLRGVGGRDTLILSTGLGGSSLRTASLYGGKVETTATGSNTVEMPEGKVAGLHIAVGLEWRR